MNRMAASPAALKFRRQRFHDIMSTAQGFGFVSNADDHCDTASELANYAEGIALHMDEAASNARRFARDLREEYKIGEA